MRHQTKFKQTEIGKIPEDWEVEKIKEVITKLGDGLHGTPKYDDSGNYYFVNGNNLVNGKIEVNRATKKCSKEEFEKYKRELSNRTIFVSINGTLGNIALYNNEKIILGKSVCYFNVKNEYNLLFIKYILKNRTFQNHIHSNATGTTIKNVSLKQMREFKFGIPRNSNEQQSIAKILSDLDAKIELNNQMNKTFETIGQALFKRWFVDERKDDWGIKKLGDYVDIIKGVSYRSDELKESNKALVTLKSMNRGGGLNKNGFKEYIGEYKKEQEIIDGDIVVACTDLTQKAEVIGRPAIVRKISKYEAIIASLDLAIIRPKDERFNKAFLYYLLSSEDFQNHVQGFTNGTTVLHLSSKAIPEYIFSFSNSGLISKFGELIKPLLNRKRDNEAQTELLIQIRDSLLPKLMSGEIRINH